MEIKYEYVQATLWCKVLELVNNEGYEIYQMAGVKDGLVYLLRREHPSNKINLM